MSRVQNADEFLRRFRGIHANYEEKFGPLIRRLRAQYIGRPEQGFVDDNLEAHARAYTINGVLEALNWRLNMQREDGLPNLIPETPVLSGVRNTVRFLDYLGLEGQTNNPLIVVEAKRPSAELPHMLGPSLTYSEVLSRGLSGQPLNGEWIRWLADLTDYTFSIHARTDKVPKRVIITNGNWLIAFLDTADAFLEGGTRDANRILVMRDAADVERHFAELFLNLEYQNVLAETPPLTPGEIPFYLSPETLACTMYGLRLRYIDQRGIYQHSPVIKVAPVIFVSSHHGSWLRIETPPQEYEIPHERDRLQQHLSDVEVSANNLLREVSDSIGVAVQPTRLSSHYDDEAAFESLHAVTEQDQDEYLIVTGERTHYFTYAPRLLECRFHDWTVCSAAGVASNAGPILSRSISPRSFFVSTEFHHCAHRDVASAKATQITDANRPGCGARSGGNGQAFCEIWRFEEYLCCRTCAFEDVCTRPGVLHLPCATAS